MTPVERMRRVVFLCVAAFAVPVLLAGAPERAVSTDAGSVSGVAGTGGVMAYLGIPYAAPPVGDLRWRPPQPAAHWTGVRKADHFGASCMQNEAGSRLPWTEEFMTQGPISEDCLFLNVWTSAPNAASRLPVMVWIYGGGFNEGSSSVAVYNGAALARKGVIVVSLNYRVGPIGFLTYPGLSQESDHHVSGNDGLLDEIAALRWVHANIAGFGGDPAKVTIFGQSAGALSVADLMQSSLATGLFARAIAESGPGLIGGNTLGGTDTLATREAAGQRYAESKGAHSLAELRALPAATFFAPAAGGGRGTAAPGGPFKDGWVVPAVPPTGQVPLLVGFVADDIGVGGAGAAPTVANYEAGARRTYGDQADTFLKLYPAKTDADVPTISKASGRDRVRVSLDLWAAGQVHVSKKMYTYYFSRAIPWPAHPEFGAFHTGEVPYVFETLSTLDRPWEPTDRTLSDRVSSYWTNFAKTGDPNAGPLPAWPAYTPAAHTTMELGAHTGAIPDADKAKLQFWLAVLAKH